MIAPHIDLKTLFDR